MRQSNFSIMSSSFLPEPTNFTAKNDGIRLKCWKVGKEVHLSAIGPLFKVLIVKGKDLISPNPDKWRSSVSELSGLRALVRPVPFIEIGSYFVAMVPLVKAGSLVRMKPSKWSNRPRKLGGHPTININFGAISKISQTGNYHQNPLTSLK